MENGHYPDYTRWLKIDITRLSVLNIWSLKWSIILVGHIEKNQLPFTSITNTRGKIKHVPQNNAKSMISEKAFDATTLEDKIHFFSV